MKVLLVGLLTMVALAAWSLWQLDSLVLLLAWALGVAAVFLLADDRQLMAMEGKAVLITGCDTGFGYHLARYLDSRGVAIFAGCLNSQGEGAKELVESCSSRLMVLPLDVTSQSQCAQAAATIAEQAGGQLLGVVNNAGIDLIGDAELTPIGLYEKVAAVNLFGVIRVTKAVLPWIRQAKGRVVTITSVKGTLPEPFTAAYAVTKFGAEAFCDVLRVEMRKWGVKVALVEPGNFPGCTRIVNRPEWAHNFDVVWESMSEELRETYGKEYVYHILKLVQDGKNIGASDPTPVLNAITHALFAETPRIRYLVDGHAGSFYDMHCIGSRLRRWMPTCFIDWFLDKYFIGDHPLPRQLKLQNS